MNEIILMTDNDKQGFVVKMCQNLQTYHGTTI